MKKAAALLFLFATCYLLFAMPIKADELDDIQKKLGELQKSYEMMENAKAGVAKSLGGLENELSQIAGQVRKIEADLDQKEKNIKGAEGKLDDQLLLLSRRVRSYYINRQKELPFALLFSKAGATAITRELSYRQAVLSEDKRIIIETTNYVNDLEEKKIKLLSQKEKLAAIKVQIDKQAAPLRRVLVEAETYQKQLSKEIAGLTARQQALLAEKTGSFSTSVGDVPAADDPKSRPDYNPGFSPAYAGFSFGAPHRKGMSQYGAFGRAKQGQSAEDILHAYYGGMEIKKDYSTGININVRGYGTVDIETYVKRIYEMPGSWGDEGGFEALKAQAVAARSYGLAYTDNGAGSICATEQCQVYKPANKGGKWEEAVNATRGWVLIANGKPFSSWYAASSGGYNYSYNSNGFSTPGGWDTKCGSQNCWTNDAYEKIADCPWFYKAWYKPRHRTATRSHPWLTREEFSDIVNAVSLYQKDNGAISHLSQTDKDSGAWSRDEIRNKLGGEAINDVHSVSVNYSTAGYTSKVILQTDKGQKEFSGEIFREIFNLRASGEIWLASALYNIEKK